MGRVIRKTKSSAPIGKDIWEEISLDSVRGHIPKFQNMCVRTNPPLPGAGCTWGQLLSIRGQAVYKKNSTSSVGRLYMRSITYLLCTGCKGQILSFRRQGKYDNTPPASTGRMYAKTNPQLPWAGCIWVQILSFRWLAVHEDKSLTSMGRLYMGTNPLPSWAGCT